MVHPRSALTPAWCDDNGNTGRFAQLWNIRGDGRFMNFRNHFRADCRIYVHDFFTISSICTCIPFGHKIMAFRSEPEQHKQL